MLGPWTCRQRGTEQLSEHLAGRPVRSVLNGAPLRVDVRDCPRQALYDSPLSATAVGQKTRKKVELYVFAAANGRAVLLNIFIRGGDSRIEQKPFVLDMRGGVSARYRSIRFTYNYVRRSRELTSPVSFPGRHDFGSFAIAWEPALHIQ